MTDEAPARCDVILRHGTVIDGTGALGVAADVGITGDRITAVGDLGRTSAAREIDATDRVVSPGFIDVHTHDDNALLVIADMTPKVSQGVTTVVAGNCGVSLAPAVLDRPGPPPFDLMGEGHHGFRFPAFGDYVARLAATPPARNAALLVGHITLRYDAGIDESRPASDREIAHMERRVAEAMAAGAVGFSTGLDYAICVGSSTEEVVALATVAAGQGGLYASHTRNYFEAVEEAIDEALDIGRRADAPLLLSHHQVTGAANFGRSERTLAMIERGRAAQTVDLDAYPYNASSTVLKPERAMPGVRILVTWSTPYPDTAGHMLDDVAAEWGVSNRVAAERLLPAGAVYFQLDEADVRRILAYPHTMIGSDGIPHDVHPHPRLWGTFPRVLGHYARYEGLFPLEEAVRRMTGLPAARFGFTDRGAVRAGAIADLVIFDPATVIDRGTYEKPDVPAAGIDCVMVNGEAVWRDGRHTGARPGRVVRREAD